VKGRMLFDNLPLKVSLPKLLLPALGDVWLIVSVKLPDPVIEVPVGTVDVNIPKLPALGAVTFADPGENTTLDAPVPL